MAVKLSEHYAKLSLAVVAAASVANLFFTVTSDAQTGYGDIKATVHRIENRQVAGCPLP